MLACLDAHYSERAAAAACVVLRRWDDSAPADEHVRMLPAARPYRPGSFYERELPALLAVLEVVRDPLEVVLVDGYVWLGEGRAGLGAHLYEALGRRVAVVGVAKSAFRGATGAEQVLRGTSRRPLWLTAAGMDPREAAAAVLGMAGVHRIPDMLRRADLLARQALRGGD